MKNLYVVYLEIEGGPKPVLVQLKSKQGAKAYVIAEMISGKKLSGVIMKHVGGKRASRAVLYPDNWRVIERINNGMTPWERTKYLRDIQKQMYMEERWPGDEQRGK